MQQNTIDKITSHLSNEKGSVAPIWHDLVTVATDAAKQSRNNFHNFTRKMKELFASVWKKIQPHLAKLYAEAKKSLANIAKGHVGLTMDVQGEKKLDIKQFREWQKKKAAKPEAKQTIAENVTARAKESTVYKIYDDM